jgi:hypothetical protein
MQYQGSCHCGAVQFSVEAPDEVEVEDCNCSICRMTGFLHLIVPATKFVLLSGADSLVSYQFNSGVAKHLFCRVCGIKCYYIPRSNPDGVDVNVRCLSPQPKSMRINAFDGQNWEANAAALAHKSVQH